MALKFTNNVWPFPESKPAPDACWLMSNRTYARRTCTPPASHRQRRCIRRPCAGLVGKLSGRPLIHRFCGHPVADQAKASAPAFCIASTTFCTPARLISSCSPIRCRYLSGCTHGNPPPWSSRSSSRCVRWHAKPAAAHGRPAINGKGAAALKVFDKLDQWRRGLFPSMITGWIGSRCLWQVSNILPPDRVLLLFACLT